MIDHDHPADDAQLEALLHATFAAQATNRVPDTRTPPPFPETGAVATVHPLRRRWVGVSLVAAVLVAIVVGATVLGTAATDSRRAPIPAGTSVAPDPAPSSSPTPSTSPTPSARPTSTPPTSTSPPPATTRQVTVQGVGLTVPAAWAEQAEIPSASGGARTCLGVQPYRVTGPTVNTCELTVLVATSPDTPWDPDVPGVFSGGDGGICGSSPVIPQQTVTADQVTVDGQVAEHRVFTAGCLSGTVEQWSVMTSPVVVFERARADVDPSGSAAAAAAVLSATLPGPRSAVRVFDRGLIRSVTDQQLRLDRTVMRFGAGTVDQNPATYPYPVSPDTEIVYRHGGSDPFVAQLDLDDLRSLIAGVPVRQDGHLIPSLATVTAAVTTDGTRVTRIEFTVGD